MIYKGHLIDFNHYGYTHVFVMIDTTNKQHFQRHTFVLKNGELEVEEWTECPPMSNKKLEIMGFELIN